MKKTESDIFEISMGNMLLTVIDANAPTREPVLSPHFHPFLEFQYIIRGKAYIKCLDESYEALEGAMAIVPPNVFHNTDFDGKSCIRYVVMISIAPNEKETPSGDEFSYFNNIFSCIKKVNVFKNPMISECIENILNGLKENDENTLYNLKAYFAMIFIKSAEEILKSGLCKKDTHKSGSGDNNTNTKLRNIIGNFVISNYRKSDVTQELSKHLNMSVRNTSRIVKKLFGVTLGTLIVNQRMYLARCYIAQTDMSVQKISELAGYNDYSTFFRTFKKHFGISPELIRKNNNGDKNGNCI